MTARAIPLPSAFFQARREAIRQAAQHGPVLDLACGRGRHALACAQDGLPTLALDRNAEFLSALEHRGRSESLPLSTVRFDLERGLEPPLLASRLGAVLVFRYLHRPLCGAIARLVAPGGLLLYETFTTAQRELEGGPRNPDFLLEPGELPRLFGELELLSFEEGVHEGAATARLLARAGS